MNHFATPEYWFHYRRLTPKLRELADAKIWSAGACSRFSKAAASRRTPKPSYSGTPSLPVLEFSLEIGGSGYIGRVKFLTKQEQMVLCLIFVLLLTGWGVKTWRAAHPPAPVPLTQKS